MGKVVPFDTLTFEWLIFCNKKRGPDTLSFSSESTKYTQSYVEISCQSNKYKSKDIEEPTSQKVFLNFRTFQKIIKSCDWLWVSVEPAYKGQSFILMELKKKKCKQKRGHRREKTRSENFAVLLRQNKYLNFIKTKCSYRNKVSMVFSQK